MNITKPIVLIGLMGAGKTMLGSHLALVLGMEFVDSDHVIKEKAGISIPEIFARDGEAFFRKVEASTIKEILSSAKPVILATGGGAYMNEETRAIIKERAICIWLRAELETLVERVERSNNRPLLNGVDKREKLKSLMAERYPVYEEADIIVDTDNNSRTITSDKIIEELRKWKS